MNISEAQVEALIARLAATGLPRAVIANSVREWLKDSQTAEQLDDLVDFRKLIKSPVGDVVEAMDEHLIRWILALFDRDPVKVAERKARRALKQADRIEGYAPAEADAVRWLTAAHEGDDVGTGHVLVLSRINKQERDALEVN